MGQIKGMLLHSFPYEFEFTRNPSFFLLFLILHLYPLSSITPPPSGIISHLSPSLPLSITQSFHSDLNSFGACVLSILKLTHFIWNTFALIYVHWCLTQHIQNRYFSVLECVWSEMVNRATFDFMNRFVYISASSLTHLDKKKLVWKRYILWKASKKIQFCTQKRWRIKKNTQNSFQVYL